MAKRMPKRFKDAHKACFKNWRLLKKSKNCGCFYCLRVFKASEVAEWCTELDRRRTALCPHCGIDSVIPDASGFPTDADFLREMKCWWFEANPKTLKIPEETENRLQSACRTLSWLSKTLPGAVFHAGPDWKIHFEGVKGKR